MATTFSGWNKKIEQIENEINNLKKSVSDGKNEVATAITGKGVSTAGDATFATMATNIGKISTLGVDTADATAIADNILSGKTAYVKGAKITGTIPSKGKATITPGTSNKTIASGQYLSGVQTIAGSANLKAENIKSGIDIFGVTGNLIDVSGLRIGSTITNKPYLNSYINSANANMGTLTLNSMGQTTVSNPDMYETGYYSKLAGFPSSISYLIWNSSYFIWDIKKKIIYIRRYDSDGYLIGIKSYSTPDLTYKYSTYVTISFNVSGGYFTATSSDVNRDDGVTISNTAITWLY